MSKRHPNYRLVKTHRTYMVWEAAKLFDVHKNTVRMWIKQGLPVCDDRRPILILGKDLSAFLQARRVKNKRSCQPGEMYCLRCREPQKPAADMVEYQPVTEKVGNLVGICPVCNTIMNRRIGVIKLALVRGQMDISFPQGLEHIPISANAEIDPKVTGNVASDAKAATLPP